MQVPPIVPSFPTSKPIAPGQAPGQDHLAAPNSGVSTVWIFFAAILIGLLAAMLLRPEMRSRFPLAMIVTLVFAGAAWLLRGVSAGGGAAGFLVTGILFIAGGTPMFVAVLLVFVLTYAATRFGQVQKRSLNIAERSHRGRDAAQVFANLGVAALFAALAWLAPGRSLWLCAGVAALAEAACDTVSSETGKTLSRTARMIVSWKAVPAGTDGAITFQGTLIGTVAAGIVGGEAWLSHLLPGRAAVVAVIAGICGMLVDSLLGATLERRGLLTNNGVNFASTLCAGLLALAIG
jgi:uncharacterized protein (TIGR00297 family)